MLKKTMNKEALAPVHVHELPPLPEEKKLPEAANDNVEIANDNEKAAKWDAKLPITANDNENADTAQIAELKERLGLVPEPEIAQSEVATAEVAQVIEVPHVRPEEFYEAVQEQNIEAGHAKIESSQESQPLPAQAAGGASKREGENSGGGGSSSSETAKEKSSGGKGGGSKIGKFLKGVLKFPLFLLGATVALTLKALISASNFYLHKMGRLPNKGEAKKPSSAAKPKDSGGSHGGGAAHH